MTSRHEQLCIRHCARALANILASLAQEAMRKIHNDDSLDQQRKAYLSQNIMASKYIVAQQRRMHANSSCSHGVRSYADAGQSVLGCSHYWRG